MVVVTLTMNSTLLYAESVKVEQIYLGAGVSMCKGVWEAYQFHRAPVHTTDASPPCSKSFASSLPCVSVPHAQV